MRRRISLTIFFPAFNEEENIQEAVLGAECVAREIADEFEIIIVDDGSTDKTGRIADDLAKTDYHVRVIHHPVNLGYGAALWSGIQASRYSWVFFSDSDLQFKLEELHTLIEYIPEYRVVIGYRSPRRDPVMRLANAFGWNILNRVLFDLHVKDIDCAFKLFDRELVADLPLQTRGAALSAELLIRLQRKGIRIKEVPVSHFPRRKGSPTGAKLSVIWRALKELYTLYRGDLGKQGTAYMQMIKYAIVGVINTFVDWGTYYFLTRGTVYFASHIFSAKLVTFMFGTFCSFALNRRFTFAVRTKLNMWEIAKFYVTIALNVGVNLGALYIFTDLLHIYDLIGVVLSTIITFIIGFTISRIWVFKTPKRREEEMKKAAFKVNAPQIDQI